MKLNVCGLDKTIFPQGETASFCLEKKTQEQSSGENRPDRQMDEEMEGWRDSRRDGWRLRGTAKVRNKGIESSPEGSWEVQVDLSRKGGEDAHLMKR